MEVDDGERREELRFRCVWPTAVGGVSISGGSAGGALGAVRAVFNAVDHGRVWKEEDGYGEFDRDPEGIALVIAGELRERSRECVQGLVGDCVEWAKECLRNKEAGWISVLVEDGGAGKSVVVVMGDKEKEDQGLFFDTDVGVGWLKGGWSVSPVLKQVWASEEEWPGSKVADVGNAPRMLESIGGSNNNSSIVNVEDDIEYSGDRTRVICGGWSLDDFAERLWRYAGKGTGDVSLKGIEDDGLSEEERDKAGLNPDVPQLRIMGISGWNQARFNPMIMELDKHVRAKLILLEFGKNVLVTPPTSNTVRENLNFADEFKPDLILTFGAGATLDVAKAVASLYPASKELRDYALSGNHANKKDPIALDTPPLPLVLIPNTISAQVELSAVSILSTPKGLLPLLFSWHKTLGGPRDQALRTAIIDVRLIGPKRTESVHAGQGALLTFCASMDRYNPRAVKWAGLAVKEQMATLRRERPYSEGLPRTRIVTEAAQLATVAEAEDRFLGRIVTIGLGMIDVWNRGNTGDGEGSGRRQGRDNIYLREVIALVAAGVLRTWGEEEYRAVAWAGKFENVEDMSKWLLDAWEDNDGRKVVVDAQKVIDRITPMNVLQKDEDWEEKVAQVVKFVAETEVVSTYIGFRWKKQMKIEAEYLGTAKLERTEVPKEVNLKSPVGAS